MIMATGRRAPTPPTLNVRNQPAIDLLICLYDLSKQIAKSTCYYHRMMPIFSVFLVNTVVN